MSHQWHVLGAGSIGSLFACALNQAGQEPVLMSRSDADDQRLRTIRMQQSTLENAITHSFSFEVSSNNATRSIPKLLVTTKSYDVQIAIRQVAHRLNEQSVIVVMVNGMGFLEPLKTQYPHLNFVLGTTTEGAYEIATNHYCHAGSGITQLGQSDGSPPPSWFSYWSQLALECSWTASIDKVLWHKLAVNGAINPLTAKYRCKNGDLAIHDRVREVDALCDEIAQLSRAEGYVFTAENLHASARDVIAATAENKSSMLQDMAKGRRTELDYITGYIIERADSHDLPMPLNKQLYNDIALLEQRGRSAINTP